MQGGVGKKTDEKPEPCRDYTVSMSPMSAQTGAEVLVRPLRQADLPAAGRIVRLAFGTFLGLPDPLAFFEDRDMVGTRWAADPAAALGAEIAGELAGSVFAANWGSVGFFGPLTVRPEDWDKGIGKKLLASTMELFRAWNTRHVGLYTFSHSTKHVHLYQKFDFWPRFLTAIMSKPAIRSEAGVPWSRFSGVPENDKAGCLASAREAAGRLYEGLDLGGEIRSVHSQNLGDTILLWGDSGLDAFAVCHCGEGTEAGRDKCYIKFGMARTSAAFGPLLDCCEAFAVSRGLSRIEAGVNLGRSAAYRKMLEHGFRTDIQGVAMHRGNDPGYNRPESFAIDDWR